MEADVAAAAYKARLDEAFPGGLYVAPSGDNAGRYMVVQSVSMRGDIPVVHAFGPSLKDYDLAFEGTRENPNGSWDVETDGLGHVQIRPLSEDEIRQVNEALEGMYG